MQKHIDQTNQRAVLAGRSRQAVILFAAIAAIVLAIDLIVKQVAFHHVADHPVIVTKQNVHDPDVIPRHDAVALIPNVLSLKLTINHGAVFGLGAGGRYVFIGATLIAAVIIIAMFWRSETSQKMLHIALALILAGALGNLYDRLVHHAVRDMLYLFPGVPLPFGWTWPGGSREIYPWIFNIADVALVIGVGLTILTLLRQPKHVQHDQDNAST